MSAGRRRSPQRPTVDAAPSGGAAEQRPDVDPEAVARAIVLRQLTMAPRSRAQLMTKLTQRDIPADVAQRVLDRFEQVGLVDDAAFAAGWVRSRHATRGLSRRALAHELRAKGIDDDLAALALDALGDDDERAAAADLVARRLPATRGLDRDRRIRRLVAMLARRGYGAGLSMQVVRESIDSEGFDGAGV